MRKTDTTSKRIQFTMTQKLQDALREVVTSIPDYHCAKSFVQDCIDSFEKRKSTLGSYEEEKGVSADSFLSARPYSLTADQIAFFESPDADEMFLDPFLHEEFLMQLRDISIPKAK